MAFSCVAETNVTELDVKEPKWTAAPDRNPVPAIVTVLPPPVGPAFGLTPLTAGRTSYAYLSAEDVALVPAAVVTVTSTVPELWAGATALSCVPETNVTEEDVVVPK